MSKYKFGIFDIDGTIVDSMPLYTEVFSGILSRRFGISTEELSKYYLDSTGTPLNIQFRDALKKNNKSDKKVEEMVEEFFNIVNQADYFWHQGAEELIKELRHRNFLLFATTGGRTVGANKKLERAGIVNCFKLILGSGEIPKGPRHIGEFAKSINLSLEEFSRQAFYCGDGAWDMEIAKMFGIYAIGVAQTVNKEKLLEAGADVIVDKIGKVIELDVLK